MFVVVVAFVPGGIVGLVKLIGSASLGAQRRAGGLGVRPTGSGPRTGLAAS